MCTSSQYIIKEAILPQIFLFYHKGKNLMSEVCFNRVWVWHSLNSEVCTFLSGMYMGIRCCCICQNIQKKKKSKKALRNVCLPFTQRCRVWGVLHMVRTIFFCRVHCTCSETAFPLRMPTKPLNHSASHSRHLQGDPEKTTFDSLAAQHLASVWSFSS